MFFSSSKRLDLVYNVFYWTLFALVCGKMSDSQFVILNMAIIGFYMGNRAYTDKKTQNVVI